MRLEIFWSLAVYRVFITLYISSLPLAHTVLMCKLYEDIP